MVKGSLIHFVGGAAIAALFGILPVAANAAPVSSTALELASQAFGTSNLEQIVDRRGVRHGRRSREPLEYHDYERPYGNPPPEAYPFGSAEWWRAMERYGRTGGG